MTEFSINGLSELKEDLMKAVDLYPDMAEKTMRKQGNEFKKTVKEIAKKETKEHSGNLTRGFRNTICGFGTETEIQFSAEGKKNPHWHLVENGHEEFAGGNKNSKGKKVGFVKGKHMVKKATLDFRDKLPLAIEKMRDEILRGSGLD